MTRESKRVKIKRTEGTPIDMSLVHINMKKREEAELERKRLEREEEEKRINSIKCPLCTSTNKINHVKRGSNGIYGPGHSSWITEEYLICKDCGVHYSDLYKIK